MCSSKPKVTEVAPAAAAAPVSAPVETTMNNIESEGTQRKKKAKGKKSLVVNAGSGTGVNI